MSFFQRKQRLLSGLLLASLLLSACGGGAEVSPVETMPAVSAVVTPEPTPEPARAKLRISELAAKNRALLRDEDGDFSDWIEVENYGEEDVDLSGFRLTDRESRPGLPLSGVLKAGERRLFWASGKDRPAEGHGDFSLSPDETVCLIDGFGRLLSAAPCLTELADHTVSLGEDGEYRVSVYPTPGYPNTKAGYDAWQETLKVTGPLIIQEACVYNPGDTAAWRLRTDDWVELKNISEEAVLLSDYCLSDDWAVPGRWRLPERELMPGAVYLLRCGDGRASSQPDPDTGFSLDAAAEQLYLSKTDGTLVDYASLKGIPYGGTLGRMDGEPGWFFFAAPSPAEDNRDGCRRVSAAPRLLKPDGVFNDVKSVEVALTAEGEIHYTTGYDFPTAESERYDKPFTLEKTTVVRAVAVEEGALPSRPAVFNYIVNEYHTLPVLSLVADSRQRFVWMYQDGAKGTELPANLSLYEEDGGFSIGCGVRMHGESSLVLEKKNMSVRFRGAYGQETLEYDVYDGGVDRFRTLVLRAGQDYYATLIKNALVQNLCLQAGNRAVTGRSKFCILYANGEYMGIYNLMEKTNEQLYADLMGVSRDSVEVIEAGAAPNDSIYKELFTYCTTHDLSVAENYEHVQELLDIDSLIDWIVLEGFSANTDLSNGNLRYARSSEGDGKWRLMLYDLDASFWDSATAYTNIFDNYPLYMRQVGSKLIVPLLRSPAFKDRMLRRMGELLNGVLSDENVLAEIDRLVAELAPEVERDYTAHGMHISKWHSDIQRLRARFSEGTWHAACVNQICGLLNLSDEQRAEYFGD